MEISKWKRKYSFLNDIWSLYEKYHEPYIEDDVNLANFTLCETNEPYDGRMPTDEYKTLCKQILKNLRLLYSDEDIHVGIDRNKRCEILNNCLYKKINQYSIPDEVINKIFNVSFVKIIGLSTTKKKCPYSSYYKDIHKDDRIILLSNFASNIDIINSILTTKNEDNYCSCRRYVNDCVNIYKDIKQIYCSSEEDKQGTDQKFPSLYSTNVTTVDTTECPLYIEEQSSSVQGNKSNSSTAHKLTTSVAAMAGISSALTLLYKFTPAGKLINLRLRGSGGRISNFEYVDGANDLLLDKPGNHVFNTYNIGYKAAH